MTKHQIAAFASKLLSIYAVIQAIGLFQIASMQIGTSSQAVSAGISRGLVIYSAVIPIFLLLGVAVVLWVFADGIAKNMVGEMKDFEGRTTMVSKDIAVVGFAVIGLFVIVQAIPHLTEDIFNYILIEKNRNMGHGMNVGMKIRFVVTIIQLAIGIGLLFGSNGLAGVLKTMRQAGER